MKLVVEVELQPYGETEEEQRELLAHIAKVIDMVVGLCDFSVGTFIRTEIHDVSQVSSRS